MTDIYHSEREIERMENNVDDEDLYISAVADDLESLNCTSDDANVVKTLIEYQHSQSTVNKRHWTFQHIRQQTHIRLAQFSYLSF